VAVPAIILAAGASRRLGRPKQLVRIAGETLLGHTIRVVSEAAADPILVVIGAHREAIEAGVDLAAVRTVVNPDWEEGIASSLQAGMRALGQSASDATAVLLLTCDQPMLTAEHLRELISLHEGVTEAVTVASAYAGVAGIPAIFPASQFAGLIALTGDTGARHLLRNVESPVICVPFGGGEVDIDSQEDLAKHRGS